MDNIQQNFFQVDTNKSLTECQYAMERFKNNGYPIVFKVKNTNWHIALVQEIRKDTIKIGKEYYSYNEFIESLTDASIKGSVRIVACSSIDADSVYDETSKIGLIPIVAKMKSVSKNEFVRDYTGNIMLSSKIKILDNRIIVIQTI